MLETLRLQLRPLAPEHWLALIEGEEPFRRSFGLRAAEGLRGFILSGDVSPVWLAQLRAAKEADLWRHGFAVLERAGNLVVGSAAFKGPPDDAGVVEIAYGIAPAFQGRGYATEAARELTAFAGRDSRVRLVRAHTLPENNASARVLTKLDFTNLGEVLDPEDGRVWRWERAAGRSANRGAARIRVVLPFHLRTLAKVSEEVELQVEPPITLRAVLDALETLHPVLRGTIRDHGTLQRRPFIRFFACKEDLSLDPPENPLPEAIVRGAEPLLVVGAMAGG